MMYIIITRISIQHRRCWPALSQTGSCQEPGGDAGLCVTSSVGGAVHRVTVTAAVVNTLLLG